MPPDPRPPRRHRATRSEWAMLHAVLCPPGTLCFCGCGRRAKSLHHLVNRTQGGGDEVDMLVPLAGDGTTLCHGAITTSHRTYDSKREEYVTPLDVRIGIRRNMEERHVKAVLSVKSLDWLNRYYPQRRTP